MTKQRFPCTPGGAVLRGRRRLRWLLGGLTLLLAAISTILWFDVLVALVRWAFTDARYGSYFGPWGVGTALVSLIAAVVAWMASRMSSNLDLFGLELDGGRLVVEMRWRRERFDVDGAEARRLTPDEIEHLERLATNGGVTAGSGGFESHRLGEFDLYASDLANAVLVDLGETRAVFTPDDPQGFLEALPRP